MTVKVYAAFAADDLHRPNDPVQLRRHQQTLDAADRAWRGWAESGKGSVLSLGSGAGVIETSPEHLQELPELRERYGRALRCGVSAGVGTSVEQAELARKVAARRGGERIVLHEPGIEKELEERDGLKKAEAPKAADAPAAPQAAQSEHSDGQALEQQMNDPDRPQPMAQTNEATDLESQLHALADAQDGQDQQQAAQQGVDTKKLRAQIAQVLQQVRAQAPVLGIIKQKSPETYAAVTALIQSVVTMARALPGSQQPMQKSILEKALGEIKAGPKVEPYGVQHSTDYSHLLPPAHQAKYQLVVQHDDKPMSRSLMRQYDAHKPEFADLHGYPHGSPITLCDAWLHERAKGLSSKAVGAVLGFAVHTQRGHELHIHHSYFNDSKFMGQGLGFPMYEALLAHGRNVMGATRMAGEQHSSYAMLVHSKLARRHGLEYEPIPNMPSDRYPTMDDWTNFDEPGLPKRIGRPGDYDKRFAPYNYSLGKAQDLSTRGENPHGNFTDEGHRARTAGDPHALAEGQKVMLWRDRQPGDSAVPGVSGHIVREPGRIVRVNHDGERVHSVHVMHEADPNGKISEFVRLGTMPNNPADGGSPYWHQLESSSDPDAVRDFVRAADSVTTGVAAGFSATDWDRDYKNRAGVGRDAWIGGRKLTQPRHVLFGDYHLVHRPPQFDDDGLVKADMSKDPHLQRGARSEPGPSVTPTKQDQRPFFEPRDEAEAARNRGDEGAIDKDQWVTMQDPWQPKKGFTYHPGKIVGVDYDQGRAWRVAVAAQDDPDGKVHHFQRVPTYVNGNPPEHFGGRGSYRHPIDSWELSVENQPGHALAYHRYMHSLPEHMAPNAWEYDQPAFLGRKAFKVGIGNVELVHRPFVPSEDDTEKAEIPSGRHPLKLPVGSMKEAGPTGSGDPHEVGKVKVQHGDGKTGWVQMRSGQITAQTDRHAPPIIGQASHPISSRNPTGH